MPSVTVKIVNRDTPVIEPNGQSGTSSFGHMWYSLTDDNGHSFSYGFAPDPAHQGNPIAPGHVYTTDDGNYTLNPLDGDHTTTFQITQERFDAMKDFGANPGKYGFDASNYNGVGNSCIDFTWAGLVVGGINPNPNYEGALLPTDNIKALEDLKNGIVPTTTLATVVVTEVRESGNTFMGWMSNLADSLSTGVANLFNMAKDFFSGLLSDDQANTQSHVNPNIINNSLLDLKINISPTSNNATANPETDFTTGTALSGGDYKADMKITNINGDGLANTEMGKPVTNNFMPGAQTLTDDNTANFIDRAANFLQQNITQPIADLGSSLWSGVQSAFSTITNLFSTAPQIQNVDPLVLDLNGNGVELIRFEDFCRNFVQFVTSKNKSDFSIVC